METKPRIPGLRDIHGRALFDFAYEFNGLGDAIIQQLRKLLWGDYELDAINPNAVDLIADRLGGLNDDIDDAINVFKIRTGR